MHPDTCNPVVPSDAEASVSDDRPRRSGAWSRVGQAWSVVARRLPGRALTSWIALGALVVGLLWFLPAAASPRYPVPVTDLGRDISGAKAVDQGVNPYQQLGDLSVSVSGIEVPASAHDEWVAHSPLAIAAARVWHGLFGDRSEDRGRLAVVVCTLLLATGLVWRGRVSRYPAAWVALAAAMLLSLGADSDVNWVQGASFLALLLVLVLELNRSGPRSVSLVLLGIVVAWRPWSAPLALFLPGSKKPIRDAAAVGSVACLATLAVLPMVGGLPSLTQWLGVALPENARQYLTHPWNMSVLGAIWPVGAIIGGVGMTWLAAACRRLDSAVKPRIGALATLALLPMVWPHYWIGLIPFLLPDERGDVRQAALLSLAFFGMAAGLVGQSPGATRLAGLVALSGVTLGVMGELFHRGRSADVSSSSHVTATMEGTDA